MAMPANWHSEFAKVISCQHCTQVTDRNLKRDACEDVPQPGYIGSRYHQTRLLLVGQNPGKPGNLAAADRPYTEALRALRDEPTPQLYASLSKVLRDFIPQWPVHGHYFPLSECGLTLEDIAYCNIVRCRTEENRAPNQLLAMQCLSQHFARWIDLLAPKFVVFVGKWAWQQGRSTLDKAGIPYDFMNRQRSLSTLEREANRIRVIQQVRSHCTGR